MEEIKEIILSHCKGIAYPEFELEDLNVMVKEINDHYTKVQSQELSKVKSLNQKLADGNAEFLEKIRSQAKGEVEMLKALAEDVFKNGYELGHDNTVESCYCGGEQAWEDCKDELLKEVK